VRARQRLMEVGALVGLSDCGVSGELARRGIPMR